MSVISSVEQWERRRTNETGDRSQGVRTHTRQFLVEVSNALTDDGEIVRQSTIARGTQHPTDFDAYLVDIDISNRSENRAVYDVVLRYSTEKTLSINPLFDHAEISWGYSHSDKPATEDDDGDGVVNSAGDPFDPAPTMEHSRPIVSIRKNVSAIPTWFATYRDAVNSASWYVDGMSFAARTAKISDLRISAKRIANFVTFRTLEIEVQIDEATWDLRVLDQGFRELDGTDRKNIVNDGDGGDPSGPVLLNGSGAQIADPEPGDAVFEVFTVYTARDFSVLPVV